MKSIVMSVIVLSAVGVLTLTQLFLGTRSAEAEAAVVGFGEDCRMFAGDGVTVFTLGVGQDVDTNNGRIVSDDGKLTCVAMQPEEIPLNDTAVMFSFENTGVFCSTGSDITARWGQIVSASGRVMLFCKNDG